MTAAERFDLSFADMLADVAQPAYPDYIDDVLDVATRGTQRPAWMFPERWLPMRTLTESVPFAPRLPWRALGVVALLALVVAALLVVAAGLGPRTAPPFGLAENGRITYMVDGDIYSRASISGEPQLIIGGDELDVYPFWAGDGSKFAFFRIDREGTDTEPELARLFVANPDGTAARAVAGPATFLDAAWSPRGNELAIVERVSVLETRLSIVSVETGVARMIPFDGNVMNRVLWRPTDGRELVFMARTPTASPGFYALPAGGGTPRRITGLGTSIPETSNIAITPDGKSIVYMHMGSPFTIRVVDIESGDTTVFGRNLPPLSPGQVHMGGVQMSSDGSKLIFGRYWDEDLDAERINHQLWAASLASDGADGVAISPVLRTQSGRDPFLVLVAPDSTQVLVHRVDTDESWLTTFGGAQQQPVDWGSFYDTDWQRLAP